MIRLISTIVFCFCTLFAGAQEKELTVGPLFTDHAILQQGQTVPVWGKARKGATVIVTFGKAKAKAKADAEGNWKAMLPAQVAIVCLPVRVKARGTVGNMPMARAWRSYLVDFLKRISPYWRQAPQSAN